MGPCLPGSEGLLRPDPVSVGAVGGGLCRQIVGRWHRPTRVWAHTHTHTHAHTPDGSSGGAGASNTRSYFGSRTRNPRMARLFILNPALACDKPPRGWEPIHQSSPMSPLQSAALAVEGKLCAVPLTGPAGSGCENSPPPPLQQGCEGCGAGPAVKSGMWLGLESLPVACPGARWVRCGPWPVRLNHGFLAVQ